MKRHSLVAVLACGAALAASSAGGQGKPASKPTPVAGARLTAIVTDTKGVVTQVTDVRARYWDPEQDGQRMEPDDLRELVMHVETRKDTARVVDEMRFAFADMKTLAFRGPYEFEITRRNGNLIVVEQGAKKDWTPEHGQRHVLERDASGALIRDLRFHEYWLTIHKQAGAVLGAKIMRRMVLGGFVGKTRSPTGAVGEFFIYPADVRSIEFK